MRWWSLLLVASCTACSGASSTAPSAPTPIATPPVVTPPPVAQMVSTSPCPTQIVGFALDLGFYQQIGCNSFDGPMQATLRWNQAPSLYLRTVDETGATIDSAFLDSVQATITATAPLWSAGHLSIASVERGPDTRIGNPRYLTVRTFHQTLPSHACGTGSLSPTEGGKIDLLPNEPGCLCGTAMGPSIVRHELGHAFGYFHTDTSTDLMYWQALDICNKTMTPREQQAAAYHYR